MVFSGFSFEFGDNRINRRMVAELDALANTAFAATQANTHVQTGLLKSSGRLHSGYSRVRNSWEFEITYGTPDTGVDYAAYEAARGPEHNPLSVLALYEPMFDRVVTDHFPLEYKNK